MIRWNYRPLHSFLLFSFEVRFQGVRACLESVEGVLWR